MSLKPAILLVCLLLLVAACGREKDKPPATAEPATGVPEASATPRPATPPESTPSAATPELATRGPDAQPTPPATGDDGLSFHFGPGVGDFDRSLIRRAVEVTRELLQDESGVQPPPAVFAYESAGALAEAFAEESLAQSWRAQNMEQRLSQTIAESSYRGIVINTGGQAWREMDATERLRVVAHEFVHVIQLEHAGLEVADATLAGSNTQSPPLGPFWLLEGSAEVVSWLVLQELGLGSYADALLDYAGAAKPGPPALTEMEAYFGFSLAQRRGLGFSVLATDYLLRSRSLGGLFEFWTEVRRGGRWQTAFNRHFGMSPASFYDAFSTYYESVWAGATN